MKVNTKGKIKKLFADSRIDVNSKVDDRILTAAIMSVSESKETKIIPAQKQIWRTILKSPITKLAVAATIILAALFTLNLWNRPNSAPRVYSVEETLAAMRNVSTIHCFITTFMEEQYEVWLEVDTKTGEYKNFFMNSPEMLKVATPNGISAYDKNKNEVTYYRQTSALVYEMYFKPLINDMADSAKTNSNSKIKVIEGKGEKPVITVTLDKDESTLEWQINAETKLPISMSLTSKEVLLPMKFNQSVNNLSYNLPLPEGIFNFKIPEGAKVKGK